jgi:hypothetical protein
VSIGQAGPQVQPAAVAADEAASAQGDTDGSDSATGGDLNGAIVQQPEPAAAVGDVQQGLWFGAPLLTCLHVLQ